MNETPNYFAIIPANIRYSKELTDKEKLLYGEITALTNTKGYCFATNNYFAQLYDVSKKTISRAISNLEKNKFVEIHTIYNPKTKEVVERRIYIDKNVHTPMDKNVQDNNTSINNTSTNNNNNIDENLNKENVVVVKNKSEKSKIKKELPSDEEDNSLKKNELVEKVQNIITINFNISISKNQAHTILIKCNNDFKYLEEQINLTKISKYENLIGFLISALENNYKKITNHNNLEVKKSKFCNYSSPETPHS